MPPRTLERVAAPPHAGGEWIFWLDGDERLDAANLHKLRGLLDNLPQANNAYLMCQWSAPDQLTGSTLIVDQTRLFRKLPGVCWQHTASMSRF